jgi:hypothetical protein
MLKVLFWTAAIAGIAAILVKTSVIDQEIVNKITRKVVDKVGDLIPEYK